jgi:hypothetical protein
MGASGTGMSGTGTGTSGGGVNQSNIFSSNFANPFSTGQINLNSNQRTMGTFNTALYPISTPAAAVTAATTGSTGGAGRVGGLGGRPGSATISGAGSSSNYSFGTDTQNLNNTRRPSIGASIDPDDVRAALPSSEVLAAGIHDVIDRSAGIRSKSDISVKMEGRNAILQGQVASEKERLQVEALIRLTPGLGQIRNELTVRASTGG